MRGFRSLRWRLTALIGAVVVLSVGATYFAVYRGVGTQLRDQIDRELRADAEAFGRAGIPPGTPTPAAAADTARRYIASQPFRASSRLLIVTLPGRPPLSNEPELVSETPGLTRAQDGYSSAPVNDVGSLRLYRMVVTAAGREVAVVAVAEPLTPVQRAEHQVRSTFLLAGSITLLIGLLAGYLVAARTAGPLRRMARIAARVDAGELSPRMAQKGPRDEVRALADSFDLMLDRLEDAFARQRAFSSDASHELRTPLTVIRGQLEVLARSANPSHEDVRRVERLVRTEILRMERLVDDLLVLARADEREFLRPRPVELPQFAEELLDGARPTADRRFELGPMPVGVLDADPDRLAQALRNLLRNAIEYTSEGGLVRLMGSAKGDRVTLAVEDDGPGIPAAHRERVFDRFHRMDSARTRVRGGAGLGPRDRPRDRRRARRHDLRRASRPRAGARVVIELPGFRPAGPPDRAYAPGGLQLGVEPLHLALRGGVVLRRALAGGRRRPGGRVRQLVLERGELLLGRLDLALERGDQLLAVLRGRGRLGGRGGRAIRRGLLPSPAWRAPARLPFAPPARARTPPSRRRTSAACRPRSRSCGCPRRRAARGRARRAAPCPGTSAARPRAPRGSRRRGGWSARRGSAGWRPTARGSPATAAAARRPTAPPAASPPPRPRTGTGRAARAPCWA